MPEKSYRHLRLEIRGEHTALVTICNPPANTWNRDGLKALRELLVDLEARREIYTLVLTGEGAQFFSAGADLNMFAECDAAVAEEVALLFGQAFETLADFRGVSIAALNGYTMGGGLEAALACDLRIAEVQALMGLPEAAVGLLPAGGGTQQLPWLVGEAWAKRIILCGERLDAATAQTIGLIEQVVPTGTSVNAALALAEQVSRQSPGSIAACKKLIQAARKQPMWQALPDERALFVGLFGSEDQREGVHAFLQKRAPCWKNR